MWKKRYISSSVMLKSGLNSGRIVGDGVLSDNYGEDSGGRSVPFEVAHPLVRLPHDGESPESLNGPVIIVQEGKKKAVPDECKVLEK